MKILFFTKGDRTLPSSRTRAFMSADNLRSMGYDAECYVVKTRAWWSLSPARFSEFIRNIRLLASLHKGDLLFLHKMIDQVDFMALALLRKWVFRRGYIFDFDDAIFLEKGHSAAKMRLMVSNADAVVSGSHFLQEYASQYNQHCYVLSAPLDTKDVYKVREDTNRGSTVTIGWTGTAGHYDNLQLILKPLQRLVDDGLPITFSLLMSNGDRIHALLSSVKGLKIDYVTTIDWTNPNAVIPYMQKFDIGLMPLQKTEFNRGKDGWKAKEYMACGVAVVISNWGENPYVVEQGITGMLVNTEDEWYEALKKFVTDRMYREKIAAAGRAYIEGEYSYDAYTKKLLAIMGVEEGQTLSIHNGKFTFNLK